MTASVRSAEAATKLSAVRSWLAAEGIPGVVLARPGSLAWLTAGITDPIERGAGIGLAWMVISPSRAVLVTTNVEAPRLAAEEPLAALGIELRPVPWQEGDGLVRLAEIVVEASRSAIASDGHPSFGLDAEVALVGLRLTLTEPEQVRLRGLGLDATAALESAVRGWRPGERDRDLQARIASGLESAGIFGACLIVGGDERVEQFRHPLAIGARIERLAMAVVVGERGGLHVALTRFASAGTPSPTVRAAQEAAQVVEAHVLDALRPGTTYGSVADALAEGYVRVGRPDAWREHYQGGPIGYRQREFEIAPGQVDSPWWTRVLAAGDAVAYNPSLSGGGKVEDTFLVTDDGPELITTTGDWPTIPSTLPGGRLVARPSILQLTR